MIYAALNYNQSTELIIIDYQWFQGQSWTPSTKVFKAVLHFAAARAPWEVRRKLHPSVVCPNDAASAFLGEAERQLFEVVYPILAVTLQNYVNAHPVMNHSSNKGIYCIKLILTGCINEIFVRWYQERKMDHKHQKTSEPGISGAKMRESSDQTWEDWKGST